MAQGLFLGGTGRRAVAHTRPEFPKMPTAPSAFPLLGAPQAPGDKPNLPEGSKSLGGRPPEAVGKSPGTETHSARTASRQLGRPKCYPAPRDVQSEINLSPKWSGLEPWLPPWSICWPPHLTGKYGTRPFLGGTGRRAVAHTRPEFPKMPTAPSAFPLLGAPQAPGDKPNLPEGSKSLGGRPPEAVGKSPGTETHSARTASRQLGRPKCYPAPGDVQSEINLSPKWSGLEPWLPPWSICWPPHLTGKYGTRPFF